MLCTEVSASCCLTLSLACRDGGWEAVYGAEHVPRRSPHSYQNGLQQHAPGPAYGYDSGSAQRSYDDPDSTRADARAQDGAMFVASHRSAVPVHHGWHDLDAQPDAAVDGGVPRSAHNVF